MATAELPGRPTAAEAGLKTAFLIIDTESVPDGRLLHAVKYPEDDLSPEEAIARAQSEARAASATGSDFLPVSFQVPVSVCVVRVANDYTLQAVTCLDSPHFRPREIVQKFWLGYSRYAAKLVTFNGRTFDLPLLELAAFRYGCTVSPQYYDRCRNRFGSGHIDLMDWMTNFGACRLAGGLDLLSKLLGKPGKMDVSGDQVYAMHRAGRRQEINDYCMFDTLDTYFVFLRTRVLMGEMTLDREADLTEKAREFLRARTAESPALAQYLDHWSDAA